MNFFLTVLIFIFIGLFGLFDFQTDGLLGSLHTFDLAVVLLNAIFLIYLLNIPLFQKQIFHTPKKHILYLYFFVLAVIILMPLRGSINVLESLRVGRQFLIIPIFFLIAWQCRTEKSKNYFINLFLVISVITSIQILINSINPEIISNSFEHVRARHKFKYDFQRNDFISKSMLFPHFACLLTFSFLKNEKGKYNMLLFLLFLAASGLQGFRSYFAILVVILILGFIQLKNVKAYFRYIRIGILSLCIVFLADSTVLNNQIYNKFASIPLDFQSDQGSTTKGRIEIDMIYSLPRLMEKPFFGWGFIHHNSEYGKKIGLRETKDHLDRPYTLYSVDSGYLSFLNMFGVIGALLILFFFFRFIHRQYRNTGFSFLIYSSFALIFLSLPTHGAFYSDFGLLPFLMICGMFVSVNQKAVKINE